jgi:hypothetical protein
VISSESAELSDRRRATHRTTRIAKESTSTTTTAIIPIVAAVPSPREFVPAPSGGKCVNSEEGLNGKVEGNGDEETDREEERDEESDCVG